MIDKSYFETNDKTLCCGCRACENICACSAISMKEDDEGFLYPIIYDSKCINCGLCSQVCPVINKPKSNIVSEVYALQYKNEEKLKNSASGGVFIGIAENFIQQGGVVFGCILDENHKAIIIEAKNENMLEKMQDSKYVSSDTMASYKRVKQLLEEGKSIFYSGAPCQIAGLRNYLKKDYDNLFTMDFLCHGMPSSKFFTENVKYLEKKYGGKLTEYKFRDKTLKGWGLVSSFYIEKKIYEPGRTNAYFTGFINGLLNRYSCYSCAFRGLERISDITVGDFWGYSDKEIDAKKGVSFVSVNTGKGKCIFDEIILNSYIVNKSTAQKVGEMNSSLICDDNEEVPEIRHRIYKDLEAIGYKNVRKKYLMPKQYLLMRIVNMIPTSLKEILVRFYRRTR